MPKIDFSKLALEAAAASSLINPRDIFNALPNKDPSGASRVCLRG